MKKAVILNDTSYESHHGCEIVIKNIIELLHKNGIETIDTNPVNINWADNKKFIQSISKCDIVIVNGEGTLHHSQLRARELVKVAVYVKEKFNLPIVLINSTYQENSKEMAKFMSYFDLIYVRETLSKIDLNQHSIESKVVPDMTFYTSYELSKKRVSNSVGVTDSVYLDLSERLYKLTLKHSYEYLPALTDIKFRDNSVKNILRKFKFHFSKKIKFLLWKVGFKFNHEFVRMFYYINGYENYIQKIANQEALIVGRYHSLCFSLKTMTPFVTITSNSHKIEGMIQDIGIGEERIQSFDLAKESNIEMFTQDEEEKIISYVSSAPLKIETMFEEIKELLDKRFDSKIQKY